MKTKNATKIIASFILSSSVFAQDAFVMPIVQVIDGDTIETRLDCLPTTLQKISIRVRGVDTPESKRNLARCEKEVQLGKEAKEALKTFTAEATSMFVYNVSWDKYGGRIDANVIINGVDISRWLIDNGFAKEYDGGTKSNWCEVQ